MTDPSIILDIEPDWSVEPEVTYAFDTAIQPTPYLGEQRRPIRPAAVRTANYKFMDTEEILQRLRYTLLSAKAEQVCVPLFNEPIFASSIVTGGSSITASTDLTYLWNIHNCSYAVLIDINTGQSEMLAVTSVSGQLIRFATNIIQTWVAAQTVIYPAMAASLTSLKENGNTDSVGSIDTEFEEIALGAEATGDWVGLDRLICPEWQSDSFTVGVPSDNDNGFIWYLSSVRHDNIVIATAPSGRLKDEGFIRFTNVTIPRYAYIVSAYLYLAPTGGSSYPTETYIYIENTNNAAQISSVSNFDSRSWSSSYVSWSLAAAPGQGNSPDIKSLVQPIVDLTTWSSGNSMQFKFSPKSGQAVDKVLILYDYSDMVYYPQLIINYLRP